MATKKSKGMNSVWILGLVLTFFLLLPSLARAQSETVKLATSPALQTLAGN